MTRVAVTGMGVVCSIGHSVDDFTAGLRAGRDGIVSSEQAGLNRLMASVAAEVKDWTPPTVESISPTLAGSALRCELLAVDAAQQALADAGLDAAGYDAERMAVSIGSCQGFVGELSTFRQQSATLTVSHLADDLSRIFGFGGRAITTTNACSASGAAIAIAADLLIRGKVDAALAGGADSLALFTLAGFSSLRSLDPRGCSPYGRSEGLTVGEGAGFLVLERLDEARERGATVLAEVSGSAMSADAYHPTAPDPTGRGAIFAVQRAIRSAGLEVDDIDYVNGHGTGTPANDAMERNAFRALFGSRAPDVPISSTKSQVGHTLGAAGVIEAMACIAAIRHGFLPPTIRHDPGSTDPDGLDFVTEAGRSAAPKVAVSTNYAFGGSNSALVMADPSVGDERPARPAASERAVITGLGTVSGLGLGIDEWRDRLRSGQTALARHDVTAARSVIAAPLPKVAKRFASGTAWRKMDDFERSVVASAQLAWRHARMDLSAERQQEVAVVLGTHTGSIASIVAFSEQALLGGGADPAMFPHTAVNAASGHVCAAMGLRGPNLSISSGGASSLSAIETAVGLIERGEVDVALVCCADDAPLSVLALGQPLDAQRSPTDVGDAPLLAADTVRPFDAGADGTAPGGVAITLVIESDRHARERNARRWAEVAAISLQRVDGETSEALTHRWERVIQVACEDAGLRASDVDLCLAAATGIARLDRAEAAALHNAVGGECRVSAPKSISGECVGSSGAVGVVFGALAIGDGFVTPTAGLTSPIDVPLRHVRSVEEGVSITTALVNVMSGSGSVGTIVLRTPEGADEEGAAS